MRLIRGKRVRNRQGETTALQMFCADTHGGRSPPRQSVRNVDILCTYCTSQTLYFLFGVFYFFFFFLLLLCFVFNAPTPWIKKMLCVVNKTSA